MMRRKKTSLADLTPACSSSENWRGVERLARLLLTLYLEYSPGHVPTDCFWAKSQKQHDRKCSPKSRIGVIAVCVLELQFLIVPSETHHVDNSVSILYEPMNTSGSL